jgi:2-polyprenyl-6-methoxyphenol hydroxylase-like FAD-dependent oxidoreductase
MRAIVIGAGIGGLSAAIALRNAGIDAAVFERGEQAFGSGAGISLAPNALAGLERLGVAERVRATGGSSSKRIVLTWRGRLLSEGPWGGVVLRRVDFHEILRAAAGADTVQFGRHCIGFEQDGEGVVARFADGGEERADVLVGADGLHSDVRTQLYGREEPRYRGTTSWRGFARVDHPLLESLTETWGPGRRIGLQRMRDGWAHWWTTLNAPAGSDEPPAERKRRVLETFRGWHEPIEEAIESTDDILQTDIYDRDPLPRWSDGRVTLLGDAAHPMTPDLGQGAAQAIEDALVLAQNLALTDDVSAALRAYDHERVPAANAIVRIARRHHRMARLEHPLACLTRDTAVKVMPTMVQRTLGVRRTW